MSEVGLNPESAPLAALKFGAFLAPFHSPSQNLALSIERDVESAEVLDRLGFDQVWFGEHHSGGYETIPSPELMIAAAAQRTRRISLCTGVISLPYHNPLMVADRMAFLDHMTRGRVIFGFGPGALALDAHMLGLDMLTLRERMEESLEAILELFTSDVPVNRETDWFTLRDARLQYKSYSRPRVPIAVAHSISPSGPRLAGKHGLQLLSLASAWVEGFQSLKGTWEIMEERAAEFSQTVDRRDWALVNVMHIAETEKQAREDVKFGLREFKQTMAPIAKLLEDDSLVSHDDVVDRINASGAGVVGTPEMAIEHIHRIIDQTGGFGTFLYFCLDWASREATLRSYELFARHVIPAFDGSQRQRLDSFEWARENLSKSAASQLQAWERAREIHEKEKA
jgi:limonene 1,2-monooxygenase